jgi:sugar/nucleoside kinase (ribokinase family)|tara:strand:+ start:16545 stop:17534 length:990 start_codon:yes stop_codon:yes gene_type:complete
MTKKYNVAAIGAALVDTEVLVTDQNLKDINLEKGLMTLSDAAQQQKNLSFLREHIDTAKRACGGSAANSMIAVSLLGGTSHLTCQVANDKDGDFFLSDLTKAGVAYNRNHQSREGITGTCLVLITPDAERTMNTCLAISEFLSVDNIEDETIEQSEWVYIEGYLATSETGKEAARKIVERAKQVGTKVAFSLSDPGIVEYFGDALRYIAEPGVDLIFANEDEAKTFTKTEDFESAAEAITGFCAEYAITLSAEGAVVGNADSQWKVTSKPVKAIDTNGAGDAFAGAYLAAISKGEVAESAAAFACKAAGLVVSQIGPRLSQADAEKLLS